VRLRSYYPALLCAAVTALCILLIWPSLESGLSDDAPYIRTAQVLAQTGHIVYNGWGAPVLGWTLYFAAILIKLFGFSFATVRFTSMSEAVFTAALLQRTMVRAGLSPWNASLGTLTVVLSPLYLVGAVTFMTDISGLLGIVVCLYACLRTLQASTTRAAVAWIIFAGLSNAILGTARQIVWLGVLVMVPSTIWLLRRRREAVIAGALSCALSVALIVAVMYWFTHQPYTMPESVLPEHFRRQQIPLGVISGTRIMLDTVLFMLPVLLAIAPRLWRIASPVARTAGKLGLAATIACALLYLIRHPNNFLAPFLTFPLSLHTTENIFTINDMPMKGTAPPAIGWWLRAGLTTCTVFGLTLLAMTLLQPSEPSRDRDDRDQHILPWRDLVVLIGPYTLAYFLFLFPRGLSSHKFLYDRYLLLVLPTVLLLFLRIYQRRTALKVPALAIVFLLLVAAYSVTTLHDCYACYRASLAATQELQHAGVPRINIDGGWEYDQLTQILAGGYVWQAGIRLPGGSRLADPNTGVDLGPCGPPVAAWMPEMHAIYGVAYPGSSCDVATEFPPVHFRTWLPPLHRTVEIIHSPSDSTSASTSGSEH
jgi:hypothetical protein